MDSDEDGARSWPRMAIVAAALAMLAVAITWTAFARGPWYDEFYTQYVTRPGQGWWNALTTSWLPDNHPPYFYMLMRATAWLGGIETHRLVNLAVAALAVTGGWIVVRGEPRLRATATVLVLALTANLWTVYTAAELRSYFISLCAGVLFSLTLASIWIAPSPGGRGRQVVYTVTALVAFNTHIITTLTSATLLAPFVAAALLCKDRARLRALLPAPLAAGLVFVCVTAFQLPYWNHNTQVFWIAGGFKAAGLAIYYAALRTLEANPLILIGSVAGGALLCRDFVRTRKVPDLLVICLLTGTGIALGFALLAGLHMMRPIIIEKYLVASVGALACAMALACSRVLLAVPRRVELLLLAAAFLMSGVALTDNARVVAHRYSWLGTGRLIARIQASCPDTTVRTDSLWNADVMAMQPTDNRRVVPWAYRTVAAQLGFHLEAGFSRRLSSQCPNLFWAEHQTRRRFDAANILQHIRQGGFAVRSIVLYRIGDGWVASDRSLDPGM